MSWAEMNEGAKVKQKLHLFPHMHDRMVSERPGVAHWPERHVVNAQLFRALFMAQPRRNL